MHVECPLCYRRYGKPFLEVHFPWMFIDENKRYHIVCLDCESESHLDEESL